MRTKNSFCKSANIRVPYPDGTMYVIIDEDDETGKPYRIDIQVSKAGTSLAAWAAGLSAMISLLWQRGVDTKVIIEHLSQITSGKAHRTTKEGVKVYSAPQAVQVAISQYLQWKSVDFREGDSFRANNLKILA